ncbi:tetratricopeptide repeat protein [Methylophaga sp.]|uniref:tetratricopeptide repeat protein n=1 Tax=Methylophaga sp. TaxID=2024840 RepID=UPI003F6A21FC
MIKKPFIRLCLCLLFVGFHTVVQAEDEYLLTEKTYKSLSKAQEFMDAEKYTEAGRALDGLLNQTESGSYDRAVVLQTIGYLYSERSQYDKAADSFQKALDANALPEEVTHNLRYNLAQLLIADGQYKKGISLMESWLQGEKQPDNDVYVLLATANYRIDNHSKVVEYIRIAIRNDADPKEDWYRLQLSSHMSLKQYKSAIRLLETLITRYPYKKIYWDQLAALYQQQDKEFTSLAVRMLADRLDLGDPKTLINLADMYRYLRIPFKSGQLLQQGMKDGVIKSDFDNLEKLSQSWLAAREDDRAAQTLQKMLPIDNSGQSHLKLGQVYVGMEHWQEAIRVLEQSLSLLKGKELGRVHVLMGTAYFNSEQLSKAKNAFGKAIAFEAQSNQAGQWLRHIEDQLKKAEDEEAS